MTRPHPLLTIVRGVLLLSLWAAVIPAQNTPYRPGTLDPAGNPRNLTLYRDEQIYSLGLPSAAGNPWRSATMSFDANLNPTPTVSALPWSSDIPSAQINAQATVGHILHPDKESVFVVQRSAANPSTLVGRFADNSGSSAIASIPNREPGYADFFSVSAGDLDNAYDSQGNYHDEVVVAWTEAEAGACKNNVVPHLGVLNYNGNDPSNPTMTAVRVDRTDGAYYNQCQIEGYNYLVNGNSPSAPTNITQPGDNIVATAVGDFDGDGQNEIALAYMRDGGSHATITVVIYRYLNDGTSTSLTPVNSYDLSMPAMNGAPVSMVATVSLSAGNFDGSGVDQLLVGSAEWWGTLGNGQYELGTLRSMPAAFLLTAGQNQAGSITSAAPDPANSGVTKFQVALGAGMYVPRVVTISGADGTWAPVNGTWPVTPTATGFDLAIDSSTFGSFNQQQLNVTTALPLQVADFTTIEAIPGTSSGGVEVDDTDVDAYIRIQSIPGLFHYDPNNGFDYRRRQIAMAWNSRAPARYGGLAREPDTHLAILQITDKDKIQVATTQNGLIGNFQLFQSLSMAAGALRGDNAIADPKNPSNNDPTWSLYFTGVGINFVTENAVARGMTAAVWKVSPVATDTSKLTPSFVCSDKATANGETTPEYSGAPTPLCSIWVDRETAVWPNDNLGTNPNYLRLPAVAADLKGNSMQLGAPVHFQVDNPAKADFILEQPPQHAAWLDTVGNGIPTVVTVSRYPDSFYTDMEDTSSVALTTNDKNHLDWNVGGSASVSASATTSEGIEIGDALAGSASQSVKVSAKFSYDRKQQSDDYTSGYDSNTVGQGATAATDDALILEDQVYDVWRYRLYGSGADTGDPKNPNAYYEIVLPAQPAQIQSNPGGLQTDWYQPLHEVGNILSYPDSTTVCSPSDLGEVTLPTNPPTTSTKPLISCQQLFYNGNGTKLSLALDHQTGNGSTTDFTNSIQADVDLSYTAKAKAVVAGNGAKYTFSSDVDIHGGSDWGHLHVSDGTLSNATGITIHSSQGDSNHAYPFYPILYNTKAGGLKVAFGVGDLSRGTTQTSFWTDFYGQKPDPALNLPRRFKATYNANNNVNGWEPETTIDRKQMKGFTIRQAKADPNTGEYPLLGRNPDEGETVLLDVRVANYSLAANKTAPFQVKIFTIPYDSDTNNEICAGIPTTGAGGRVCPAAARTFIGMASTQIGSGAQVFQLGPRAHADAYYLWTVKNLGPAGGVGTADYRVYVVLDSGIDPTVELNPAEPACTQLPCEGNAGNENIVDPGQNNEGWELMSVGPPNSTLLGARQKDGLSSVTEAGLDAVTPAGNTATANTGFEASAAGDDATDSDAKRRHRRRKNHKITAYVHRPFRLRVSAFSNAESRLWEHAVVYDLGENRRTPTPASLAEAQVVAGKFVRGTRPGGSFAWFTWTPKSKGLHHLYVTIQNPEGTRPAGELFVSVRRAPGDLNGDGRVDRHDINMLNRDLDKRVSVSACGESCDLDGDGKITAKDGDLLSDICDAADCGFGAIEYVGGPSAEEPDMRAVRNSEQGAMRGLAVQAARDAELVSDADAQMTEAQLYQTERQTKASMRSIRYYYRGKPVAAGPYAPQAASLTKAHAQ